MQQRPGGEPSSEDTLWKEGPEETAADLYAELCRLCGGKLTTRSLVDQLLGASALALSDGDQVEDLIERVLGTLAGAANMFGDSGAGALARDDGNAGAEQADAAEYAESLAYGWPAVHDEHTLPRAPGHFAKSFPLKFPMGVADLFDDRDSPVTPPSTPSTYSGCLGLGARTGVAWPGLW